MRPSSSSRSALACSFAAGLACATVAQVPRFKVELVGAPGPGFSGVAAGAVNDAGQVIGNTFVSSARRAWIGAPGLGLQLLPLPPGANYAEAYDLNASGTVVGRVLINGNARGVIWRPGPSGYEAELLPAGPGGVFPFDALGINDRGDVVGKLGILSGSYVWNNATGVVRIAGYPVVPQDINNQRQVIGDTYRMDLDTGVLENLGNPVGTGFRYMFSDLWRINDAGQCGGYGNVATGMSRSKQAVRFTDGPVWRAFNAQPARSANVMGLAASGDTAYHTGAGAYGSYVFVEGYGSVSLPNTVGAGYTAWDLSGSFSPVISRGGRVACNGINTSTGEAGIVLLTLIGFDDLGGASPGALGAPILDGYGRNSPSTPTRLRLAAAAPLSPGFLAASSGANPVPFFGGVFYPDLASGVVLPVTTNELGRVNLTFSWPATPPGAQFYLQAGALDPAAAAGVSLSNAIVGTTQ